MRRALAVAALLAAATAAAQDPYVADRESMVRDQIAARGVRNSAVLRAMRATKRHLFVPDNIRPMAYRDHPLPIGHRATISQPYIVALMTELLEASENDKVLEIGTGSGYQAAILSQIAGRVYSIEIVPELAESARERLRSLGYRNVTVRQGDGYRGWREHAPFDRIILTAAPEEIPGTLIEQLRPGGRIVAPAGAMGDQQLMVLDKRADGSISRRSAGAVRFVPMTPDR